MKGKRTVDKAIKLSTLTFGKRGGGLEEREMRKIRYIEVSKRVESVGRTMNV